MIIAIVNQKGGTGKTTTTLNLGSALVQLGKSVLVLDMDPQGSLSYSLGITEPSKTIADLMLGQAVLSDVLVEREGMRIAPSTVELADVELTISMMDKRERILEGKLSAVTKFDYILIDCPPSLSLLTVNALTAADELIIPMQMEVLSLQGLDLILRTAERIKKGLNRKLLVRGLLPVMVDPRRKLSTEVHAYIQENYELKIFNSIIHANVRASEAPSFGKSVLKYAPRSKSALEYLDFAKEILTNSSEN